MAPENRADVLEALGSELANQIDMKTYLHRLEHDLIGFSALEISKYSKMSLIRVVTKKNMWRSKKNVVVKINSHHKCSPNAVYIYP